MNGRRRIAALMAAVSLLMLTATAAALDCITANSERVDYELVAVTIDGARAETNEFGSQMRVIGSYDDALYTQVRDEEGVTFAQIDFSPQGAR